MSNLKEIDQFVDELVNLFHQSSPDKYIILVMKIESQRCSIKLSKYNESGIDENKDTVFLECDNHFYDCLKRMVSQFRINCKVIKEDIVNLDGDEFVAFRMITKNNDLFTIDGLTMEFASELLEKVD